MLESTLFHGIADSREIVVNSKYPVEIEKIHVVEGQRVIHGQLLVELSNPEITLKINQIAHQLEQLEAQKELDKSEIESKIVRLKARKQAQMDEFSYRIQELENLYTMNTTLTSKLKSVATNNTLSSVNHPTMLKIEGLKQELDSAVKLLDLQINLQEQTLAAIDKPIRIQISQLKKELVMLKRENNKLNIYSTISGMIGSVNCKPGEKVSPFAPIVTLCTQTPAIIKGYIRENESSYISVGDTLTVTSKNGSRVKVQGSVVGVGSRIVEYPMRLSKHPDVKTWGREIVIKIPETNNLILGEKVQIRIERGHPSLWTLFRNAVFPKDTKADFSTDAENPSATDTQDPEKNVLPITGLNYPDIEASAMLYLPDLDLYFIASDDTPGKQFMLFLMDRSGQIVQEIRISDAPQIDDIEAMTSDDENTIYIAASMSAKKNGKTAPSPRRQLVTLSRTKGFKFKKSIDLLSILKDWALTTYNSELGKFVLNSINDAAIDVEGIFWHDQALFVGFKSPLYTNKSFILKIDHIKQVIEHQSIAADQIHLWKLLSLKQNALSPQELLSDLFYSNGNLFITSVQEPMQSDHHGGSLWRMNLSDSTLHRLYHFTDLRPEGIAAAKDPHSLTICFDQGRHYQSQLTFIKNVR